jgi:hypothetical protein
MKTLIDEGKIPPINKYNLSTCDDLKERLKPLVGQTFPLTRQARTDGSNFRKLITNTLLSAHMPDGANENDYSILPPKGKGVPSFLREYIDTYIITSGDSYNLQVWNRNPNSDFIQVEYSYGDPLLANEVRFVLGKINVENHTIESIFVLTPEYIVNKFGKFGKPTIKQQAILSNKTRDIIINTNSKILFEPDCETISHHLDNVCEHISSSSIRDTPTTILPLSIIRDRLAGVLIGLHLDRSLSTKQRGQELERVVAISLGYNISEGSLIGGYPDLPNQMLEVKLQDSQTIDLGKFSPQFMENIILDFNTENTRYLIALANPLTGIIEGFIISSGKSLGKHLTYISDKSFKCQRGMTMDFFNKFNGEVVYNPD